MNADRGLRGMVPAACRATLRAFGGASQRASEEVEEAAEAAADEHVAGCSFCRSRIRAADILQSELMRRPRPASVSSDAMLEAIYARASEQVEAGPVGRWLEQDVGEAARVGLDEVGASHVLQHAGERAAADLLPFDGDLRRRPAQPDAAAWSEVRRSILEGVAASRVAAPRLRVRPYRTWLAPYRTWLAGAAASLLVTAVVFVGGDWSFGSGPAPVSTSRGVDVANAQISFVDVTSPPSVGFVVARRGAAR